MIEVTEAVKSNNYILDNDAYSFLYTVVFSEFSSVMHNNL